MYPANASVENQQNPCFDLVTDLYSPHYSFGTDFFNSFYKQTAISALKFLNLVTL